MKLHTSVTVTGTKEKAMSPRIHGLVKNNPVHIFRRRCDSTLLPPLARREKGARDEDKVCVLVRIT